MKKLIFSTALGLLAATSMAYAQEHRDDHDQHGAPPAAHGAPHPGPAAHGGPAPSPAAHGAPPHGAPPHPGPAPHAAPPPMPHNNASQRGNNGRNNFSNGRNNFSNGRNNFSAMHRNFNAPRRFHAPSYRQPRGWYSHRWTFGEVLPSLFWAQNYWLNDYAIYDLPPPPPGTVWVRDGSDAILIDRVTGEIIQVQYDAFY